MKSAKYWKKNCPVKSIEVKKDYTPWLTSEMRLMSNILQRRREDLNSDWTGEKQREIDDYAKQLKTKLKSAESEWKENECKKMRQRHGPM